MTRRLFLIFCLTFLLSTSIFGQNVVIVVIDGVRYSESFGSKDMYMPALWRELRPLGTIWLNFYNDGITKTNSAHASIVTGTWQSISSKGEERSDKPTIFEYFRKTKNVTKKKAAIISGKYKLKILTYSSQAEYGMKYGASFYLGKSDEESINIFKRVIYLYQPEIILINLADVDSAGHSGKWNDYISAIKKADSLVYVLWTTIQSNSKYNNRTTLFVLNDHGRHDDLHGGFKEHGDNCEGCRHIMLLAVGRGFSKNIAISRRRTLCDLAPTIGELLSFPVKYSTGESLLRDKY